MDGFIIEVGVWGVWGSLVVTSTAAIAAHVQAHEDQ